jgi:L-cysteate sulfo-lyase
MLKRASEVANSSQETRIVTMHLSRFPRVKLGHGQIALEPMPNLSRHLGGPNLFIERDDCTGLASGGNKTRKLECLIGAALAEGATRVITQGATQSNHVRQTTAAAAKHGLRCTAFLEKRVCDGSASYYQNGNVLLDHPRPRQRGSAAPIY